MPARFAKHAARYDSLTSCRSTARAWRNNRDGSKSAARTAMLSRAASLMIEIKTIDAAVTVVKACL
jgi:hypothetical protein